ncbi:4Fe-4S binding protein [Desulfotalea psychrophila]|uniref:Related to iron-sulfur proteins n=1 Tax=Desulfotalea psychrophila (strain LSv54 / DSM 12343) TaxID=177439 RepID=Q6ARP7_DESPS|nr:4Fe-4S binding protein [Desulfotalea psychrophila]CAG34978.1 related to iron-sulfur proteins [Desulfotalea psychrophila LSv54]
MHHTDSTHLIYFSPTNTSKSIGYSIAEELAGPAFHRHDLTFATAEEALPATALAIIVVPVYAGRIAPLARKRLEAIRGAGTPAVLVVVYGNRDFEDALLELQDLAQSQGFVPLAAAAFIGEHSYSTSNTPIGAGRPDEADLLAAKEFGREVAERLAHSGDSALQVPGNAEYRQGVGPVDYTPQVDSTLCNFCETCTSVCPAGIISAVEGKILFEAGDCIRCCACIKSCPTSAISFAVPALAELALKLHNNCRTRKEPRLFF